MSAAEKISIKVRHLLEVMTFRAKQDFSSFDIHPFIQTLLHWRQRVFYKISAAHIRLLMAVSSEGPGHVHTLQRIKIKVHWTATNACSRCICISWCRSKSVEWEVD